MEHQTLTAEQLVAIEHYESYLVAINDPIELKKKCLGLYIQSLKTHNTYLRILKYQNQMESAYRSIKADSNTEPIDSIDTMLDDLLGNCKDAAPIHQDRDRS